jgi:hypothetical protein
MKAKLIRTKDSYHLWLNPETKEQEHIASINPILNDNGFDLRKHKLSKQNCDEIFRAVDVEELAEEETKKYATLTPKSFKRGFMYGFNKAMELNKDKVFTLEQMSVAYNTNRSGTLFEQLINSFGGQPTEIEVEIEMECPQCQEWGYVSECRKDCNKKFLQPKLDSEGCLTLKKI